MIRYIFSIVFALLFINAVNAQYEFKLPEHFRTERNLPLLNFQTTLNVKVTDFGAMPDDGKDDAEAFRKALDFCKKTAKAGIGVKLVFYKGTYDFYAGGSKFHLIELKGANNIIIDGNGSEIIIHDPLKGFFSVFKSSNIIVKNMIIDYDPLPFTQGKVVGVNVQEKTFDFKIEDGFPSLNMDMFQDASRVWGMLMDPNIPGKLKDGAPNYYASKEFKELEPGVFRITLPGPRLLKFIEIGDNYVHVARTNGSTIFKSVSSKNITYLNNTSYTSPAGSYAANNMEEWNIIGCEVKLKEGRLHSANADCMHVNGGKFGPWIENSLFEGYSDDAVNIKSAKRSILKQTSPTELIVKWETVKGDVLRIYNPREGKFIGSYTVTENKFLGDQKMRITLDRPIEVELNVGDTKLNDIAYLDSQSNESFVIRNNTFRNARRYGILIQASYGLIERNVFENLSQNGISLINGVDWGEGFIAHDIIINQNVFNNCGYDDTYLNDEDVATIFMKVVKLKNPDAKTPWKGVATTDWQGLENITITNNIFSYNKRAISVECSKNTVIKGNKFMKNSTDLTSGGEVFRESNNTNLLVEDLPSNN
jgi:parallel beta-helix repeat protein